MYFHYFIIISPWKRAGPINRTNLNSLHPRMLCAMFGWNWFNHQFWRRRWKCEKFTTTTMGTTTTTTDNRQILIRKAYLSLRLRWANIKTIYSIFLHQFSYSFLFRMLANHYYCSPLNSSPFTSFNMFWKILAIIPQLRLKK